QPIHLPHETGDRAPVCAYKDEQGAGDPHVNRTLERAERSLHPRANAESREQAVVQSEQREKRHIPRDVTRLEGTVEVARECDVVAEQEVEQRGRERCRATPGDGPLGRAWWARGGGHGPVL